MQLLQMFPFEWCSILLSTVILYLKKSICKGHLQILLKEYSD